MKKVSICIPCFNRSKYISGAVASCLQQTYENIEVIAVDDGSKDDTLSILKRLARKDSRLKVLANDKNRGISYSFNRAIKASTGDFITLNGSDDYYTPDSVEKRIKEFTPELDIVYGVVKVFYSTKGYKWCASQKLKVQKRDVADHAILFRRSVFERYGLFCEEIMVNVDAEMWYRLGLIKRGGVKKRVTDLKIKKIPAVCAYVRIHKGSTAHTMSTNRRLKERHKLRKRIKLIHKYGVTKNNTEFL